MKKKELNKILDDHKLWLSSEEKEGSCADLIGVDLKLTYLRGANLSKARLIGADLRGADLKEANLMCADLSGANLYGADLIGAVLIDSNLRDVNLSDANLFGANLRGSNLIRAKNIQSFQCGKFSRVCYAVRHEDCVMFQIGCLWGTSEEVIKKIREDYGDNSHYEKLVLIYADPEFWIENGHGELK